MDKHPMEYYEKIFKDKLTIEIAIENLESIIPISNDTTWSWEFIKDKLQQLALITRALELATESARSWQHACQCHQDDYKKITVETFMNAARDERDKEEADEN